MDDLTTKKCIPCEEGGAPLTPAQAEDLMPQVHGWELQENATKLYRKFPFKDFAKALAFVNEIGKVAEEDWHHPDIAFGWGRVEVTLTTHSMRGLSENDFIVAAKINLIGV